MVGPDHYLEDTFYAVAIGVFACPPTIYTIYSRFGRGDDRNFEFQFDTTLTVYDVRRSVRRKFEEQFERALKAFGRIRGGAAEIVRVEVA